MSGWIPTGGGGGDLDDLDNVDTTGKGDGDTVVWNAGDSEWQAAPPPGSSVNVEDNDTLVAAATTLNFGTNLTVTDDGGGQVTIDATGGGGGSGPDNHFRLKPYTTSPAPNASYPDNERPYAESLPASPSWNVDNVPILTDGDIGRSPQFGFAYRYLGWQSSVGAVTVRVDAGSAVTGSVLRLFGVYGSDQIGIPVSFTLEWSDDDASWTTVTTRSSMGSPATGQKMWMAEFDVSSAGSHRYWRILTTGSSTWLFISEIEMWSSGNPFPWHT